MSLANKKSSIHQHLLRHVSKKRGAVQTGNSTAEKAPTRAETGLGKLQVGKEALSVPAAHKTIFGL